MTASNDGRAASGQALVNEAPAGLHPSGFDPSRERPWQPWERNFSGGRIGVQEQQGPNDNWMILHVESGVAKTTTSLRPHEAWDLALMLSPQLKARLDELFKQARAAEAALHTLKVEHRGASIDTLRLVADQIDCGDGCEAVGPMDMSTGVRECDLSDRGECPFDHACELRDLASALEAQAAQGPAALDALTLAKRRRGLRRMVALDEEMELGEKASETERLYNELLYAVSMKHGGETRHETALRYIRERERDSGSDRNGGDADAAPGVASQSGPKGIAP